MRKSVLPRWACLRVLGTLCALVFLPVPCSGAVLRVKADAPGPGHDGASWQTAFVTIQAALDVSSSGDEVWVAAGTYAECLGMQSGVGLYGGFAGLETSRYQRNGGINATIIEGVATVSQPVIAIQDSAGATTTINGFTIRNGRGGGIHYYNPTQARGRVVITNNRIIRNGAFDINGGGILCIGPAVIANNLIDENSVRASLGYSSGGGIYCADPDTVIRGNTITRNRATSIKQMPRGGAVYFVGGTVVNNIVAFNSSGLYNGGASEPVMRHNDVYGNPEYDFSGMMDPTGTEGNIRMDPSFTASGDYHLLPTSPAVDTGDDAAVEAGETDLDGGPRIQGVHVNMGAYETPLVLPPVLSYSSTPAAVRMDQAFSVQPVVEVRDPRTGELLNGYTGPVTLAIKPGTGATGARLSGTVTVAFEGGIARFTNLAIDLAGTGYVLTASSGTLAPVDSLPFDVLGLAPPQTITRAAVPITPDGLIGISEWYGATEINLGEPAQDIKPGNWSGIDDYRATVRLKWDAGHLYFLAEVDDDVVSMPYAEESALSQVDALEIFLGLRTPQDPNRQAYDRPGDYHIIVTGYGTTPPGLYIPRWYSPQAPETIHGNPDSVKVKARKHDTHQYGYRIEGALPWSLLTGSGAPVEGQAIGFNVQADDRDLSASGVDSAFSLSGLNASDTNPARWTTATLVGLPPAPDGHIVIRQQPSGGLAGTPFAYQPVLELRDSANLLLTGFNDKVTVSITPGTGTAGAQLTGSTTVTSVGGIVTFSGISIDRAGTGYVLVFTSGVLAPVESVPITMDTVATRLAFVDQPGGVRAGLPLSPQPVVAVQDEQGATAYTFSGPVSLEVKAGTGYPGVLLGGTRTLNAVQGVASFTDVRIPTAASGYVLTASGPSLTGAESAAFDIAPFTFSASDLADSLRWTAGTTPIPVGWLSRFDVVENGRVDLSDAARIARKVVGLEPNP